MNIFLTYCVLGNSLDKLYHTRSVAYSAELILLNKQQISGGGAYLCCIVLKLIDACLAIFCSCCRSMYEFKTQKGAVRFRNIVVTSSLLIFFSKPIWDIFLSPMYWQYLKYKGQCFNNIFSLIVHLIVTHLTDKQNGYHRQQTSGRSRHCRVKKMFLKPNPLGF